MVAIGLAAGGGGVLLILLLRAVQHLFWSYHSGAFLHAVEGVSHVRRVLVLTAAGVLAGVGVLALRWLPGFGGGEVSEALWLEEGRLELTPSVGRSVLSMVVVAMGASLGREAGPQLTAAAIASRLCEKMGVPRRQRQLLVACGAGAGMAAVYNVPLGGALFALEVLLGTITLPLVLPALLSSLIAAAVGWLVLSMQSIYVIPSYGVTARLVVWAAVVGPLAGLAAVAWVRLVALVHRHRPTGKARVIAPIVVLAALGAVAVKYPELLGNGRSTVQLAITGALSAGLLAALVVLKPLFTAACLGSGVPGGLFTPTLAFGVLLGGLLGHAWGTLWPGTPGGSYALVGGAAVLAASMQGPLAAVVLVLELARHTDSLMVPLLLAVSEATILARVLGAPSIYSARLGARLAGEPADTLPPPVPR